jgi:hypothetical protein
LLERVSRFDLRDRLPGIATVAVLLVVIGTALAAGINRFPSLTDDEGTYVAQAWAVRANGALAHYTYWYDHPPFGWVQLSTLTTIMRPLLGLFDATSDSILEARHVMLVPALVSALLVYVLARRLAMSRVFAAIAMAVFALSPLSIAMLRQVLLDGFALPWMLAAFVLAASPHRRLWSFAGAGACAAVSVLSKETMLIVVPALIVAVWQQSDRRTRSFCLTAFVLPFVLLVAGYPLLALLKGELFPGVGHVSLLEAARFQLFERPSTGTPLTAGSASRRVVDGWLGTDSLLLIGGAIALPFALTSRTLRPVAIALAALIVVALRPGYLPQPYVMAMLPLAALLVAGVLQRGWDLVRTRTTRLRRPVLVGAITLLCIAGLVVGGRWATVRRDQDAFDANASYTAAQRWVTANVGRDDRVLVDDTFYVDLVEAGFRPQLGVVWFYKLDTSTNLDPSVVRELPKGAEEFDVVISTPIMRSALEQNPGQLGEVRRTLRSSELVVAFGPRGARVEVRRLTPALQPTGGSRDAG